MHDEVKFHRPGGECAAVERRIQGSVYANSAEEARLWGQRIGNVCLDGDVLCLDGDLGAGKTTLVQGLAAGLGVRKRVTSPTFTLVQEYEGRIRLYHLDCYRLGGPEDLEPLGAEDWLGRDGICAVEWADRVQAGLPADCLVLRLTGSGDGRLIRFEATGPIGARLARNSGLFNPELAPACIQAPDAGVGVDCAEKALSPCLGGHPKYEEHTQ
jgi:tRNA threonylcarbamoyladenosine biosynthesis protein TsaE